jgi:hypothetical protein
MSLEVQILVAKVHRMDHAALLRLRDMLQHPDWLGAVRCPTDAISQGISDGAQVYREGLREQSYSPEMHERLTSRSMCFELKLLNDFEARVRANVDTILAAVHDRLQSCVLGD